MFPKDVQNQAIRPNVSNNPLEVHKPFKPVALIFLCLSKNKQKAKIKSNDTKSRMVSLPKTFAKWLLKVCIRGMLFIKGIVHLIMSKINCDHVELKTSDQINRVSSKTY